MDNFKWSNEYAQESSKNEETETDTDISNIFRSQLSDEVSIISVSSDSYDGNRSYNVSESELDPSDEEMSNDEVVDASIYDNNIQNSKFSPQNSNTYQNQFSASKSVHSVPINTKSPFTRKREMVCKVDEDETPKKKNSDGGMKCEYCEEVGHLEEDCYNKECSRIGEVSHLRKNCWKFNYEHRRPQDDKV